MTPKRKQSRKGNPGPGRAELENRRLLEGLDEVTELIEAGQWDEALDAVLDLDDQFPGRAAVYALMAEAAEELRDALHLEYAVEGLHRLDPDEAGVVRALAEIYRINNRSALALETFRQFLVRWPDHSEAAAARQAVEELEAYVARWVVRWGEAPPDTLTALAQLERSRLALMRDDPETARRLTEAVLASAPRYIPALNHLSLIEFVLGHLPQAIELARHALDAEPDNWGALSNLIHYHIILGQRGEAEAYASRLRALEPADETAWQKMAEGLSYLGDDAGVLDVFRRAALLGVTGKPEAVMLLHFAAVANLRLGQEPEARRLWEAARQAAPGLDLVEAALADLDRPLGERAGTAALPLGSWLPVAWLNELLPAFRAALLQAGTPEAEGAAQQFLSGHPEAANALPALLDRGDVLGQAVAAALAEAAGTPELLAALKAFALGQRASDLQRVLVANRLVEFGVLPPGTTRLWRAGAWQDHLVLGMDMRARPEPSHRPQVQSWLEQADEAVGAGQLDLAERLLLKARKQEPDKPDLMLRLAEVYQRQDRGDQVRAVMAAAQEHFPDEVPPRAYRARQALRAGDTPGAEALLRPAWAHPRGNSADLAALGLATIELLVAQNDRPAAQQWLDMWSLLDPEAPELDEARRALQRPGSARLWPAVTLAPSRPGRLARPAGSEPRP